jgi:hypothetical protein
MFGVSLAFAPDLASPLTCLPPAGKFSTEFELGGSYWDTPNSVAGPGTI